MRRTRWIAAAAVLSAFALAAPAAAHDGAFGSAWWMGENHPGWYGPSPESQSKNLKIVGSVSRTRRRLDLPQLRPRVLGRPGLRRPLRRLPDRRHLRPGEPASRSSTSPARARSTTSPSGATCCSSRSRRRARARPATPRRWPAACRASRACGSSTCPTRPSPSSSRACRRTAARTPTRWCRMSRTAACCSTSRRTRRRSCPSPTYGNECRRLNADGTRAHQKISVVEVPLGNPAAAKRRLRADVPAERPRRRRPATTAATTSRCSWRSSGPPRPAWARARSGTSPTRRTRETIARVHNPNVEFFHSAAFSWDGKTVVFGDEAGGGTGARCRSVDPRRQPDRHARRAVVLRRRRASTTWTTRPWSRG